MKTLTTLEYNKDSLSESESRVIEKLLEVGQTVHEIWLMQVDPENKTTHLYPEGVSKADVRSAAAQDELMLSPYSVVKKDGDKLFAVSYREEYSSQIDKVVAGLREAVQISEDAQLKKFLTELADLWDKGDFRAALKLYLSEVGPKIEVLMGPIETYEDKLMGIKKTFQFNLRIRNEKETIEGQKYLKLVKSSEILKPIGSAANVITDDRVILRVDEVVAFGGRQYNTSTSATNLPNEIDLLKECGTKIVIYRNSAKNRFENRLKWYVEYINVKDYQVEVAELEHGFLTALALHEMVEAVVKFEGSQERLENYWDAIRELNAYLLGVKSAKLHLLTGLFTERDYYNLLLALVITGLFKCEDRDKSASIMEYARGFALFFNYMEKRGALTFADGKISVDISTLSKALDDLSKIILSVLEDGTSDDAHNLFARYGSFDIFEKFPRKQ